MDYIFLNNSESVFLDILGSPESIPSNRFLQTMYLGGPVQKPYSHSVPAPIDSSKIPAQECAIRF